MADCPLSATRSAPLSSDSEHAVESADRASEQVLFFRQAGTVQGQLESSTEFHLQRWIVCLA